MCAAADQVAGHPRHGGWLASAPTTC